MISSRYDAATNAFLLRQLEAIDAQTYVKKYAKFKSRQFIPTQQGVSAGSRSYLYRMFDSLGEARVAGNAADDQPRANATGEEFTQVIKTIEAGYDYSLDEIEAAQMTGTNLDSMKAIGARRAMEEKIDKFLAVGSVAYGLKGLLSMDALVTDHPSVDAWGTLETYDADKILADILGAANTAVEATDEEFNEYRVVLPLALYNLIAQAKLGSVNDTSILKYVLATSPYIKDVQPWYRTENGQIEGVTGTHRLCAYPMNAPEVVAGLVPREVEFMAPQERNLALIVNGRSSCGGVVCRYPKAIAYCDIDIA